MCFTFILIGDLSNRCHSNQSILSFFRQDVGSLLCLKGLANKKENIGVSMTKINSLQDAAKRCYTAGHFILDGEVVKSLQRREFKRL